LVDSILERLSIFIFKMKRQELKKLFALIGLPLMLTEAVVRYLGEPTHYHSVPNYHGVLQEAQHAPIDMLFIGDSRVRAAIFPTRFAFALQKLGHRRVNVLNLGLGYTTLTEHYLGLKRLVKLFPDKLRGATVFIDLAYGVPNLTGWNSEWAHELAPLFLSSLLDIQSTIQYWQQGTDPIGTKGYITLAAAWHTMARIAKTRTDVIDAGELWTARHISQQIAAGGPSLTRTLQSVTAVAGPWEAPGIVKPEVWRASVLYSLVDLIHEAGGETIFYQVPSHPAATPDSPWKQRIRANLNRVAAPLNARVLNVPFPVTGRDFPDIAHLAFHRAPQFTDQLAEAYMHSAPHSPRVTRR
jgi:hypothetical protein